MNCSKIQGRKHKAFKSKYMHVNEWKIKTKNTNYFYNILFSFNYFYTLNNLIVLPDESADHWKLLNFL